MNQEIIRMSKKEVARLEVIAEVVNKRMKQEEGARLLCLSSRQVRRLIDKVKTHGEVGLVHGNRGKVSPRRFPKEFKEKVVAIVRKKYCDFGPSLATEKLKEEEQLEVNRETVRGWMIENHLWTPGKFREKGQLHCWRKRKECFGEMVQTDGSIHDWLEGRGEKMVLMGYIDDATNQVFGRFYPQETTLAAMDSFRRYIERYGIPRSLYFDRNSIYKTTRQANLDEQLAGQSPKTQFEMVLEILKVEPIHAYSPQAKGRIEKLFSTLQDRLVKEMRLAGVNNLDQVNSFLEGYLQKYNSVFSLPPANPKDLHRAIPEEWDLDWVFALREKRVVSRDFTVAWKNRSFLLTPPSRLLIKASVTVLENLQGDIKIWFNNRFLEFQEITPHALPQRRKQTAAAKPPSPGPRLPWKPPPDHPWRRLNNAIFAQVYAQGKK